MQYMMFVEEAKQKKSVEPEDTRFMWKLCGTSNNDGLVIKQFTKVKTDSLNRSTVQKNNTR